MCHPRRYAQGFTLLEVLVALAVVAIALAAAVKAAGENAVNTAYLRDKTLAHWVAMNKVAELQLAATWPAPGVSHGQVSLARREWRWQAEVENTDDPSVRRLRVGAGTSSGPVLDRVVAYLPAPAGMAP
jgi:general secretion pathway protein I